MPEPSAQGGVGNCTRGASRGGTEAPGIPRSIERYRGGSPPVPWPAWAEWTMGDWPVTALIRPPWRGTTGPGATQRPCPERGSPHPTRRPSGNGDRAQSGLRCKVRGLRILSANATPRTPPDFHQIVRKRPCPIHQTLTRIAGRIGVGGRRHFFLPIPQPAMFCLVNYAARRPRFCARACALGSVSNSDASCSVMAPANCSASVIVTAR